MRTAPQRQRNRDRSDPLYLIRDVLADLFLDNAPDEAKAVFSPRDLIIPAALPAYDDPTRHRVFQWGRGSSKTTTCQWWVFDWALKYPDVSLIYLLNTAKRAKDVLWPDFCKWNREYGLGGKTNGTDLTVTFENGARVFVSGADRMDLFDRKRGIKKVIGVVLGECQDWEPDVLKYAVTKVFMPRLGDMEATHGIKGRIILEGTGTYKTGYFYQAASNDPESLGYGNTVRLTQWDNPYMADPDGEFQAACKGEGARCWKMDTPVYSSPGSRPRWYDTDNELIRREWFAENNQGSSELKVFKKITTCKRSEIPAKVDELVVGGDYGTVDAMTTATWALHKHCPYIPLVETTKEYGLSNSKMVRSHRQAAKDAGIKYHVSPDQIHYVGDGGGLGKGLVMDIAEAEQESDVDAVDKRLPKAVYLRQFASDLADGYARICEDETELLEELSLLEWDVKKVGERVKGHVPDKVDAASYAWRRAKHIHAYEPPPPPEDPDDALERRIQEQMRRQRDYSPYD